MTFYFRVDADSKIGMGHIVRSVTLAKKIKNKYTESNIRFIISKSDLASDFLIRESLYFDVIPEKSNEEDFIMNIVKDNSGIFLIDNIKLYSNEFIRDLKEKIKVIMIHSYSESRFNADISIYPCGHLSKEFINDEKWNLAGNKFFTGAEFSLLNEQVLTYSPKNSINLVVNKISFLAGGSDPTNSLIKFSEFLKMCNNKEIQFYFLVGKGANYFKNLSDFNLSDNIIFKEFNFDDIYTSDIVYSSFGVTIYELTYLRIPTISYGHTELHAIASERYKENYNCTVNLGLLENITSEKLCNSINENRKFENRNRLFLNSYGVVDGKGAERFINEIDLLIKNYYLS